MQSRSQLSRLAESLQGIPVWGALPGSRAESAGVRYGDVLLSVNGRRTANFEQYLAARNLRDDMVVVVVFRDGVETTLEFPFEAGGPKEPTQQQLEEVANQVVAARMLPTERPPPPAPGESTSES